MSIVRDSLSQLIKERGLTQEQVARSTGLSTATINLYLSGTYRGNVDNVEKKICSYIDIQRAREQRPTGGRQFVETSVAKNVMEVAMICHRDGVIGVCVGDSGLGKTFAIKEYARRHRDVILIEAHRTYRTRDVMADIHTSLRLGGRGTIHSMMQQIIEKLKGSGRMLIIDEAEHLQPATLDEIRRLHDFAGIAVLYVGLERFRESLVQMRRDFAYIVNRVRIAVTLNKLKKTDTEKLLKCGAADLVQFSRDFHAASKGVARTLDSITENTARAAREHSYEITPELIMQVAEDLTI